jgi:hypothetical protein
MSATLDQVLVFATIGGAAAFFAARFLRGRKKGCDSGCGCDVARKTVIKRP